MRRVKLFRANLIQEIILFAIIAIIMSIFFGLTLQNRLTEEFTNRGSAITKSIASSSVELLLGRDASTIQARIDQFLDTSSGVSYVFVIDDKQEFIAHTFAPAVPPEILNFREGAKEQTIIREVTIAGQGDFIHITSPILAGVVGYVHLGMDKGVINANIQSAIMNQVLVIALLFVFSAIVAYIQTNRISQPLIQLAEYSRKVASGSASTRQTLQSGIQLRPITTRTDEIGQLGQNFQRMVQELYEREQNLEERVANRTQQLETVVTISQQLASILDVTDLMRRVVDLTKETFNYYHVHIYLVHQEMLLMVEGYGEAGAEMRRAVHNIPLAAPKSLVARAAREAKIITVDNVHNNPEWLANPFLPHTQSEIAIPIILGGNEVAGVLDIQSDQVAGFSHNDKTTLRALANQIAVAIRNARLFAETQDKLYEAQRLQRIYTTQAWEQLSTTQTTDYEVRQGDMPPLAEINTPEAGAVLRQEQTVDLRLGNPGNSPNKTEEGGDKNGTIHALATPLKLRGQIIGVLGIRDEDQDRQWTTEEIALIETVSEQMTLAIENARLFDDTQKRGQREALTRQIVDEIRKASTIEEILQTSVDELSKALGVSRTFIDLNIADKDKA